MTKTPHRFVGHAEILHEIGQWGRNEWLCRPDLVAADKLMMVRVRMAPGHSHPFHRHPHREEILYIIEGQAEQWVDQQHRLLRAGEIAHIPAGMVHATYNPHSEPLVFLAILSPAILPADLATVMDPEDVAGLEPWKSLRAGMPECEVGP